MILAAILSALAALHIYWAAGGSWGSQQAIPRKPDGAPLIQPGPIATLVVAGLLLFGAAIATGGILIEYRRILLIAMGLVFAARAIGDFRHLGFFKRVKGTAFAYWDTRLFSPLCVLLATLSLY